jgi:putative ABC transport system permease protein
VNIERAYAALLVVFPPRFRTRYGGGMREAFREQYRRRSAGGRVALAWFLAGTVLDVFWNATQERLSAARNWMTSSDADYAVAERSEETRAMTFETFVMDLRYALRRFLRAPLFTSLAVGALALGIGGASAIFSIINGVLLKPLPYASPDDLVMVWSDNTRENRHEYPMSPANFLDYKASATTMRQVEAMFSFVTPASMRTDAGTEQVTTMFASPGMFSLLGRSAATGRAIVLSDSSGVVVLSDGFWTRRFGRDPAVVGSRIVLNERPFTILGVMPRDFVFPFKGMLGPSGFTTKLDVDLWTVLDPSDRFTQFNDANGRPQRNVHFLAVLGRLADGATPARARDEALTIAKRLEEAYPESNRGLRANVVPLHQQAVGQARAALMLLAAGVGFVFLLACVNVANLLLAQSVGRQKEMAVRAALGARRSRLLRQSITETLLLSGGGAAVGFILVHWTTSAFAAFAPGEIPRLENISPDGWVLAFTIIIALASGLLVGIVPALAASRTNVQGALVESGRGTSSGTGGRRARAVLVTVEIALAVILTVGAGLLVRSFVRLTGVDAGFSAERLLTLQVTLPAAISTPDARRDFYSRLFARLESVQGVQSVGGTTRIPLASTNVTSRVFVEGRSTGPTDTFEIDFRRAVHHYFRTMGMPILRGRDFNDTDGPSSPQVAIVNQTMARRLWGDDDPVGRKIRMGPADTAPWTEVVGVVGDVHHASLDLPPAPEMYVYYLGTPPVQPFLVLRTTGDPAAVAAAVRADLKNLDKDLSVYDLRTGNELRAAAVSERRFIVALASVFGILALSLAAIGVYGVMALMVTERAQEMGIRLALGADPARVLGLVIGQGLTLATIGIGLGVAVSLGLTPLMSNQLFGVGAIDPITLGSVTALLFAVSLLACAVPARRAMAIDPVTALRAQ